MVDEVLLRDFGRIWPKHVAGLTQFLIECRKQFDGDLDLFLILCIIGDRTFSERHVPEGMNFETWNATSVEDVRSVEINIQSISDFSGIPRETVRRKLAALVDRQWVIRDERGSITATDKAKDDLEALTMSSLTYLSRMKVILSGS